MGGYVSTESAAAASAASTPVSSEGGAPASTTESTPPQAGYFSYATDTIYSCGSSVDNALCGVPGTLVGYARSVLGKVFGFLSSVKTYIYELCCYSPSGAVAKAQEVGVQMRAATTPADRLMALQSLNEIENAEGDDPNKVNNEVKKAAESFVEGEENLAFKDFAYYLASKGEADDKESDEQLLARAKEKLLEDPRSTFVADFLLYTLENIPAARIAGVKQAISQITNKPSLETAFAVYIALVKMSVNPDMDPKNDEEALARTCQEIFFTFSPEVRDVVTDGCADYTDNASVASLFRNGNFKDRLDRAASKLPGLEEASAEEASS